MDPTITTAIVCGTLILIPLSALIYLKWGMYKKHRNAVFNASGVTNKVHDTLTTVTETVISLGDPYPFPNNDYTLEMTGASTQNVYPTFIRYLFKQPKGYLVTYSFESRSNHNRNPIRDTTYEGETHN